jgi:hypothetical protein
LQERLVEVRTQVHSRVGELPNGAAELRGKLESGELRHALENYRQPRVREAIAATEDARKPTEEA